MICVIALLLLMGRFSQYMLEGATKISDVFMVRMVQVVFSGLLIWGYFDYVKVENAACESVSGKIRSGLCVRDGLILEDHQWDVFSIGSPNYGQIQAIRDRGYTPKPQEARK